MNRRRGQPSTEEHERLREDERRERNWKRWGPYLAERQWGTVREDYSADNESWRYFPHDHARSRAYRWGEDGLLGITDRQGRLALALALWNKRDPILKERLFGLTGPEGNHGEDVKEHYFYLDSTPTHSYLRALYKYPQAEYPYERLVEENGRRSRREPEFELADTGAFDEERYFDVFAEFAKASPNDILVRYTVHNRGPDSHALHVLPTLWFRNTWSWGREGEGYWPRPDMRLESPSRVVTQHASLGEFIWSVDVEGREAPILFTENETDCERIFGTQNASPWVKDGVHRAVVEGRAESVRRDGPATKAAAHFRFEVPAGESVEVRVRLSSRDEMPEAVFGDGFESTFRARREEADAFYESVYGDDLDPAERAIARQAHAGLLWTKQFYHYSVEHWLEGDPAQPAPPESRQQGRNHDWLHLYNRDVISMPDKWEYPWYAAWDLAFHMIPFARVDPHFAKEQLVLFLREWYQHPNGQIPAYEFDFGDVNPPVHAWAAWRVYKMTAKRGQRDLVFLARVFHKMLLNFTWWVNRTDSDENHVFAGGFLGLDNIGVFDRSKPLPTGGQMEQADGTAWMGFFCITLLEMALELARHDPSYEGVASKFFEHFVAIADAINTMDGTGLWSEKDGFYYDHLRLPDRTVPLEVRSMVGLVPLFAVGILDDECLAKLPGFRKRLDWFVENRPDKAKHLSYLEPCTSGERSGLHLLAIPSRERLERLLSYVFDEAEFLSPHGVRSLSRVHAERPYSFWVGEEEHRVSYVSGESDSWLFGGNSNWRGPVWFPVNYLVIEALEKYHHFYGDSIRVECPKGSGRFLDLRQAAHELARRLGTLFKRGKDGRRPADGQDPRFRDEAAWRDLHLFWEYFDGDSGRGLGASHQTGWTALVVNCLEKSARERGGLRRTTKTE